MELITTSDGSTISVLGPLCPPPIIVIEEPKSVFQTVDDMKLSLIHSNPENMNCIRKIGSHISRLKSESLSECMTNFAVNCHANGNVPCQMFLRNPHRGSDAITGSDFDMVSHVIEANDIRYYTHAAYIINLSKPTTKRNPNSDKWIMSLLTKDLENTAKMGGRGVVVHVGKYLESTVVDATNKMEFYIRRTLESATERCPLLLETAAGQGTELLSTIEEMSSFYSRFSEDDKKRFKICVDTCHVFSAGYDPLDYLERWHQLHPNSIGLVHFNDSEREKGSRVDRHSYYMKGGYIGFDRLMKVAQWCLEHNIDMVTE